MKNKKAVTFIRQKSYLLAAGLMLVAVFGMTGVYFSEQQVEQGENLAEEIQERNRNLAEEIQQEVPKTTAVDQVIRPQNDDFLDSPEIVANEDPKEPEETDVLNQETTEEIQETATERLFELHFDEAELSWPLNGDVLMYYSMDSTVLFKTLGQYKTNPAIIISGKVNDPVTSVADGRVSNIVTNEETGYTVTVDLGDGYSAVYGQLKEINYNAGDYVDAGAVIGYVGEPTKYYSEEGPNLYFAMIKDNAYVDPMGFLEY